MSDFPAPAGYDVYWEKWIDAYDQTLENLLEHAVSFGEQLETFEYIYELTVEEADIVDHDEEEEIAEGTQ